MSYWGLNAIFLSVVVVIGVVALVVGLRRGSFGRRGLHWVSALIALCVLLVVTAVFDNVMIGIGLVGYDPRRISGVFIGVAPLEDFAYPIAAVILLPALWLLFRRDGREGS